ncbi:alpha/beta hydrolase, partial [Streptomyces sp. AC627_RSS907]|uniref:alpha/beta hydrolase n=1 Tax=Streptomyces sp. AC627_RSS907 TaxID=2823684 RepID=UPI001C260669
MSWVHTATAWRTALALVVVFVLLATSGWAVGRRLGAGPDPLSASLAAWGKGAIAGRPLPDTDSSPRRLARFFDSLTGAQLTRLVRRYPLAVGNLNGAPVGLRYRANRLALRQARLVERERTRDDRLTPYGQREAGRRVHRYEALLSQGRQILAFDPAGSGRVAEVFGNLATARRVSVVVPG